MFSRTVHYLNRLIAHVKTLWGNGNRAKSVLTAIAAASMAAIAATLAVLAAGKLIAFVVGRAWAFLGRHEDSIIIGILITLAIAWFVVWRKNKNNKQPEQLPPMPAVNHAKNHRMLGKCLFDAMCGGVAEIIGLVTPSDQSKLSPLNGDLYFLQGNTAIYRFFILKKSDAAVSITELLDLLEQRFEQMQTANQLPFTSNQYFIYKGQPFNPVLVMGVREDGRYIDVNLAFASDDTCEMLMQSRRQSRGSGGLGVFHDDEL